MEIAIIGSGSVGFALAEAWAKTRHSVRFGARNIESERARAVKASGRFAISGVQEAVIGAEVVLLAVPWAGAVTTR